MKKKLTMKKGFTLMELLAVIVILAIIISIALPKIIQVVENARKEAWRDSVYVIIHAGNLVFAKDLKSTVFAYQNGLEYNADDKVLHYRGAKPQTGSMVINDNGTIMVAFHNGTYCATKASNESKVTISTNIPASCLATNLVPLVGGGFETVILSSNGSYTSETENSEDNVFSKEYYTLGYIVNTVTLPYRYTYNIDLGILPIDISKITSVNIKTKSVFETLDSFKSYIIKKNMGEVIWPGEIPVELDLSLANVLKNHSANDENITINNTKITCNSLKCSTNIDVTINDINGIDTYLVNGNEVVYIPIKFNVEFNGEEVLTFDYGTSIPSSITNLYSSWSKTTPLGRSSVPGRETNDNTFDGNYQWVHTILFETIDDEILLGTEQYCSNIYGGANTYNLSNTSETNRWLTIWIHGAYWTSYANYGALSLVFNDDQNYTLSQAVNNGYIEPLLIYASSYTHYNTPYIWTNMVATITGGTTSNQSFSRGFYYFKVKDHGLKAVKLTASKSFYAQHDGIKVYQWEKGKGLSLSPIY